MIYILIALALLSVLVTVSCCVVAGLSDEDAECIGDREKHVGKE